jgi:hypothetical protein
MTKRCPTGEHRFKNKCVPKEEAGIHAEDILPDVIGFTREWKKGNFVEAKKYRLRVEKVAHKGAMPYAPDSTELGCPKKLAKEVACASNMIRSGRATGYQANAVCRASLKRTQCQICKTLPGCRKK